MESGGYALVWSLRFQNLWAAQQLLLLLAEELRSVRIESAGVEGEGVDMIVTARDGPSEVVSAWSWHCSLAEESTGVTEGKPASTGIAARAE
jgi:hypothetical protein